VESDGDGVGSEDEGEGDDVGSEGEGDDEDGTESDGVVDGGRESDEEGVGLVDGGGVGVGVSDEGDGVSEEGDGSAGNTVVTPLTIAVMRPSGDCPMIVTESPASARSGCQSSVTKGEGSLTNQVVQHRTTTKDNSR
jgi:hypothetical protein